MQEVWLFVLAALALFAAVSAWRGRWRPYDPTWLVALAREQHPDDPELARALSGCTRAKHPDSAMVHFVSPRRPNESGSQWQYSHGVTLNDPEKGELILDILRDGRVGAMELLDQLLEPDDR